MIHLLVVALALAVLATAEGSSSSHGATVALAGVVALVAASGLGAWLQVFWVRRAYAGSRWRGVVAMAPRVRLLYWVVLLAGYAALVHLAGWPGALHPALSPDGWPLVGRVVGLVPFGAACAAAWWFLYELEPAWALEGVGRGRYLGYQARQCGVPAVPFLLFLGVLDLAQADPSLRALLFLYPVLQTLLVVAVVASVVLFAPVLVRRMWPLRPLPPGELRGMLEDLARRAGVTVADIYLWDLGAGRPANACVTGVAGFNRSVLLSEGLVERLHPAEVAAVFAHELGHARLRHFVTFVGFALGFLLVLDPMEHALAALLGDGSLGLDALSLAMIAVAGLWLFLFGWLSRRLEQEADIYGARLVGSVALFIRTLRRVGAQGAAAASRWTWRHFPMDLRVHHLYRVLVDPTEEDRVLRRGRVMRRAVAALVLTGVVLTALSGADQVFAPRHRLDLRRAELAHLEERHEDEVAWLHAALEHAPPEERGPCARELAQALLELERVPVFRESVK